MPLNQSEQDFFDLLAQRDKLYSDLYEEIKQKSNSKITSITNKRSSDDLLGSNPYFNEIYKAILQSIKI